MASRKSKRIGCLAVVAAIIIIPLLYIVLGPGIKLTAPVMKLILKASIKEPSATSLADGYDKKVGHIHNVTNLDFPESREVNEAMVAFLKTY